MSENDSGLGQNARELFLYNGERLVLLEEQMAYFHSTVSEDQFKLIDHAKISDIVHLVSLPAFIHTLFLWYSKRVHLFPFNIFCLFLEIVSRQREQNWD